METGAHAQLKRLAVAWLLRSGCTAAAAEVMCPIARHRLDAAGYLDRAPIGPAHDVNHARAWIRTRRAETSLFEQVHVADKAAGGFASRERCEPRTIVIECKQSRGDFLRETLDVARLLGLRDALTARRDQLEAHIREGNPDAIGRNGSRSFLFAHMEEIDEKAVRHATYRRVLREIAKVEQQLYGETKFSRMSAYRLADRMYIMAPRGMIGPREVPTGWGLIECAARWKSYARASIAELTEIAGDAASVLVEGREHSARPERRSRMLRQIALAATRAMAQDGGAREYRPTA